MKEWFKHNKNVFEMVLNLNPILGKCLLKRLLFVNYKYVTFDILYFK